MKERKIKRSLLTSLLDLWCPKRILVGGFLPFVRSFVPLGVKQEGMRYIAY